MREESYRDGRNTGRPAPRTRDAPPPARDMHRQHHGHEPRSGRSPWHWLLWLPVVLALVVPMYNRLGPGLFGVPFFYWWQLILAAVCSAAITVVYLATKDRT